MTLEWLCVKNQTLGSKWCVHVGPRISPLYQYWCEKFASNVSENEIDSRLARFSVCWWLIWFKCRNSSLKRSQIHLEVTTKCNEFYLFSHYKFLQVWPLCNDYHTSLKEILTGKNYFLMISSCTFLTLSSLSIVVKHYWSIHEASKMHLYWIVSKHSLAAHTC